MDDQETFADDTTHPIPQVDTCDVHVVRKGGGAELALVIATPLKNDLRSRKRLMKKIENYLGFIASGTFAAECGVPTSQNTKIAVHIHPGSDPEIFGLIEKCRGWVEDNRAALEIKRRPNQSTEPTRTLGTSAAEQPRVPSARVAHL